jgi:hypothetical protein
LRILIYLRGRFGKAGIVFPWIQTCFGQTLLKWGSPGLGLNEMFPGKDGRSNVDVKIVNFKETKVAALQHRGPRAGR